MTERRHADPKIDSMYLQHWFRFAEDGRIAFLRGSEDSAQTQAAFA